ncbi:MAG: hypothetical protein AWU57_529 [Marinobacter sp. T13-3]|nr:MAG: hypothetical protein AWU57_529 [Marinobacter sp. T13-3]
MFDNVQALTGSATAVMQSAMGYFRNFAGEIGTMESVLLNMFTGIGVLIAASAILDLARMSNPKYQGKTTPKSIAVRFMVGPATIQLNLFVRKLAESIFGDGAAQASMSAQSYSEQASQADPVKGLMAALIAFLIFIGWVSALRAMLAFARIGSPNVDGYEQFRTGAARLIAATFLCMFQFVMDDVIESFTGKSGQFTSTFQAGIDLIHLIPIA